MIHLPTLKQLRHFAALADTRNFGRAAAAANVTQSTLSASLQELEAILGAALVDRTRRSVLLIWMPKALPALRKAYPQLKLFLVEDLTERLVEKLANGAIDVALLALPCDCGPNAGAPLGRDAFRLVVRRDDALAKFKTVPTAEIRKRKLLLLADGHCMKRHALAACGLRDSADADTMAATSLFTLVQMVDNGLGITLLPQMALDAGLLGGTDLVALHVEDDPARDLGLVWRKGTARQAEFSLLAAALVKAADSRKKTRPL